MKTHRFRLGLCALLLVCSLGWGTASAATFRANDSSSLSTEASGDAFLAGSKVSVGKAVAGELFAAGSDVTITSTPGRSVYAAGSTVTIEKGAGYNVFAAGSTVTIHGTVEHDVYAAGSTVVIAEDAEIKGDLRAAGATVEVRGAIMGSAWIEGSDVTIKSVIGGSLDVRSPKLTFETSNVAGNLTYSANDVSGIENVTVTGTTTAKDFVQKRETRSNTVNNLAMVVLASLALGAVLIWRFGETLPAFQDEVRENFWPNFWAGFSFLFVTPIVVGILLLTMIGYKVAFVGIALYVALLLIAGTLGLIAAGRWVLEQFKSKSSDSLWAQLLVGVLVVHIIEMAPYVGWLVGAVVGFVFFFPALGRLVQMVAPRKVEKRK